MEQVTELKPSTYQVFINHRGEDTKKNLASLIYYRLKSQGLNVFLDENEIDIGARVTQAIRSAIDSASVHIALFSPLYAHSIWCLDEFFLIKKSFDEQRSNIIPVFYDVDPTDLRNIEANRYAEGFRKHKDDERYSVEQVDKWKKALKEAADLKGFVNYKTKESNQGEVLEEIVENVWKWVKWPPLEVASHSVGLEQAAEAFKETIEYESKLRSTKIVTITGTWGAGKSTLAKYLFYNSLRPDFRRASFLSEVRAKDSLSFQRQLFHDLIGSDLVIKDSSLGKSKLAECLSRHRVLIVLDQVEHIDEINSLLDMNKVGCGSLILITSRHKFILQRRFCANNYEVQPLDRQHARQLFCQYAFFQPEPVRGSENFVERILEICGRLPFSLIVWGKQVQQDGLQLGVTGHVPHVFWNQQLEMFSRKLPKDIFKTLNVIYEDLCPEDKDIFLDIGCFLAGEDTDLAVRVLEGLRYKDVRVSLDSLCAKSLVNYDVQTDHHQIEYGTELESIDCESLYLPRPKRRQKIIIQDQVRLLARQLANEQFRKLKLPGLRFSCVNDIRLIQDGVDSLQDGVDSLHIRGIRMAKGFCLPDHMDPISGIGVRLIALEIPIDLSDFFRWWNMRGKLVWLRLHNFGSMYFPSAIELSQLRVLELQCHGDHIERLFERFYMQRPCWHLNELTIMVKESTTSSSLSCVRHINISDGGTGPYFSGFLKLIGTNIKNLQTIVLKNIKSLKSLPINFGELKQLTHLDLSGCTNLTTLPFSKLLHLQYLALRECSKLYFPTNFLVKNSTLEYADFKGCDKLTHLPGGLASQRSLRYLNLLSTHLNQFPEMLELVNLEQLRIGSPDLSNLPGFVFKLSRLKVVVLNKCSNLKCISQERIEWPEIKVFAIESCPIAEFRFQDQGTMRVHMPVLRDFTLKDTSISEICIPESVSAELETLDLSRNARLIQLNGLPSTLVTLSLEGCSRLKTLINLSNLVNLKFLNINGCHGLETLDVKGLTSLEEIKAQACLQLHTIKELSQPGRLNSLQVSTHNGVFWNDIFQFLALPSNMSTAIFSGKAYYNNNYNMISHDAVMQSILNGLEHSYLLNVPPTTADRLPVRLNNIRSYGAIFMCFITNGLSGTIFRIRFERSNRCRQYDVYETLCGDGSEGRSLHIFMFTEESKLVKDESFRNNVDVCSESANNDSVNEYNNFYVDYPNGGSVEESNAGRVERGWIVAFQSKTQLLEVCKRVIFAFGL